MSDSFSQAELTSCRKLSKVRNTANMELDVAKRWDEANAFSAGAGGRAGKEPFTIMLPPPNVTGSLHIGHAFNVTLQDILARFERMRGKDVLWQPGTDHAGIATQMMVERQLKENNEPSRHEMGRKRFVERIWQWKKESGNLIFRQMKRLGASCDWSRERFTMDKGFSEAVLEVFVRLFREGLIYRDKRLVNWDPGLCTAISDLEVEQVEVQGSLWHFRYPLEEGVTYEHPYNLDMQGNRVEWKPSDGVPDGYETRDYLIVATTRPETIPGDTGVAVHPDDPRYESLVGKHVILPLVGRRLLIVADEYPDPEAGTGAVKITPAHDFNDFDVGSRNALRIINIMNSRGNIFLQDNNDFMLDAKAPDLQNLIELLDGKNRFTARKIIVEMMETRGLLAEVENHKHMVPHGDRSGVPLEPFLTDQWYVRAEELAGPAIASVREKKTDFVPKNWENTYFNWMENIQPWCISRQLWWGHQIPAWYGPDGKVFVEKTEAEAQASADVHYGCSGKKVTRDSDVLDTWFSSALWPFVTLGWPEKTSGLARYYQTDVLFTGFDIIFFWVARMMMSGLHFMKDENGRSIEPFHTVYVHALVRDRHGAKMSKTRGNAIDPLELIDQYGADALRFSLAIMAVQGRDVKLDPVRVAGYRNFGTKLWNATRFAEINGAKFNVDFKSQDANLTVNRWILTELSRAIGAVTENIEKYRFNDAAGAVYKFVWHIFCDWYLELLKPVFSGEDKNAKCESQACAGFVLVEIYKLLHPFMPFMTEELWQHVTRQDKLLCHAQWPGVTDHDDEAADEINWLIRLVSEIRSVRVEMGVKPSLIIPLVIIEADKKTIIRSRTHAAAVVRLARVQSVKFSHVPPERSAQIIIDEATFCLPLDGIINFDEECLRLEKDLKKLEEELSRLEKKLANKRFIDNAPEAVVNEERKKLVDYQSQKTRISIAYNRIRNLS